MKIGRSVIQHGPLNRRVYLMKLAARDFPDIMPRIDALVEREKYTKIFTKVPAWAYAELRNRGYLQEAFIPAFYQGVEDAFFLSKFVNSDRAKVPENDHLTMAGHLKKAFARRKRTPPEVRLKKGLQMRVCDLKDAEALARLYKTVFQSYPFPVHDPAYIEQTMKSDVLYFGIFNEEKLVAASSAEMDIEEKNAEMTDFATLPESRGQSFSTVLLQKMEQEMMKRALPTLFTIARSLSAGMNITFARNGYRFSGTLVNNTNISGKIESMNIWYKRLMIVH